MLQKFSFHTLHFPGTSACLYHPPEHGTTCMLCTGTAFAAATTFSSPKNKEEVEIPPRGRSWQEVGRACTTSKLQWGFSAEDNSLGYRAREQWAGECWGNFFQQHFVDVVSASLAL